MAKNQNNEETSLVIVESPAKAKTIEKFLGAGFRVESSIGHIRDLPEKEIAIDIENGFTPKYVVSDDKKKVVSDLKKLAAISDKIWLATDEDREGEAIAWHLYEALDLKKKEVKRIVFHEITKTAINKAINNPRDLNMNVVNAQQARRVLDRLVGYQLSPVLWKKVRYGLSAGRVQSVASRLIVDREREIQNFIPDEFFKVFGNFKLEDGSKFKAELKEKPKTEQITSDILKSLIGANFKVADLTQKPGYRSPSPPFTTSTLQQEASRKLGFSVRQTMSVAQKLYESGKITYMRTDSVNLSEEAITSISSYVKSTYGDKYSQLRRYTTKSAGAQEAHEAIRPTNIADVNPSGIDASASKLYDLIRKRALACQMANAEILKTQINIENSNNNKLFGASAEVITFDGFLKVYMESRDDDNEDSEQEALLPPLKVGQTLHRDTIVARQSFSRPPARYNEAALVKKLEEMGIGRPSTYAPTISTIQDREYVVKEDREGLERQYTTLVLQENEISLKSDIEIVGKEKAKLFPTDTGAVVSDFLVKNFPTIVDFGFTARAEEEFDEIANGNKEWNVMIAEFYKSFSQTVADSDKISRMEATQGRLLGDDPKTGKPIYARIGRFGAMLQMGSSEDEDKPRFAPMPKELRIETISLEESLKLFELPRIIGADKAGNEISANIGRFGPYLKCGKLFVSIKPDELYSIDEDEACKRIDDKREAEANKYILTFETEGINVLNGRFGPYISNGEINAKIPKDIEPKSLTLEQCKKLLAESKSKPKRTTARKTNSASKAKATKSKTTNKKVK